MKDPKRDAGRWLEQAEADLHAARVNMREEVHSYACFLSQQSGEKALKALAYLRGDRSVLGHSVIDLVEALEADYPSLAALKGAAAELDLYYLTTRYPDALPGGVPARNFSAKQAATAIAHAAAICAEARRLMDKDLPR